MNVPLKYQKSNEIDQDSLNKLKAIISKYTVAYKKYLKASQASSLVNYKDKVLKWLFSFPLDQRQMICSIENKWATTILHQLYCLTITKPQLRFIPRDSSSTNPLSSFMKPNQSLNQMSFQPSPNHFLNYFAMVSEKYDYHPIDENILSVFLQDLKFYHNDRNMLHFPMEDLKTYASFDPKDYFSFFILGNKILYNETNFSHYFNTLSNNNLFSKPLAIANGVIDQPDWSKQFEGSSLCFSLSEIIAALFEQVISVKYVIDCYGDGDGNVGHIGKCLSVKKELIEFLKGGGDRDLYVYLRCEEIAMSVYYDVVIERMVEDKMYKDSQVGKVRRMMYWENNCGVDKVLKRVKEYMMGLDDEEVFVERMMFGRMNQLYTCEDYFQRKVLAYLNGLYTKSITDDLVNKLEMDSNAGTGKKNRKKRKKKAKKGKEVEESISISNNNDNGGSEKSKNDDVIKEKKRVFDYIKLPSVNNDNESTIDDKTKQVNKNDNNQMISIAATYNEDNYSYTALESIDSEPIISKEKKVYNFILSSTSNIPNTQNKTSIVKYNQGEFMGNIMFIPSPHINSITPTFDIMIKSIINDLISSLPLTHLHQQQGNISDTTSSENDTLPSSNLNPKQQPKQKQKKQKASKFFLYPTEPKKQKAQPKAIRKSFISKLNTDIMLFDENTNSILTQLTSIKQATISQLKTQINSVITLPHDIELYGSFENGLSIEGSDIDMQFIMKNLRHKKHTVNINGITAIMTQLTNHFQSFNDEFFASITPIYSATVPIIKLKINPEAYHSNDKELLSNYLQFKASPAYSSYLFNKEELDYIKIDLTFNTSSTVVPGTNHHHNKSVTKEQVNYIKEAIGEYQHMKPIIKIIKRILNIVNLNNAYTGGLSSYTVFLMVYAFQRSYLKPPNNNNHGHLLIDFFTYYSLFDLEQNIIDVSYDNPFAKNDDDIEMTTPIIIDPVTNLNAAKSSFKVKELKELFKECSDRLSTLRQKYEDGEEGNMIQLLMKGITDC